MTQSLRIRAVVIAAVALTWLSTAPAAQAHERPVPAMTSTDPGDGLIHNQQTIDLAGFDLSSADGIAQARRMVSNVALAVCAPETNTWADVVWSRDCYRKAREQGFARIEAIRVARLTPGHAASVAIATPTDVRTGH